MAKKKASTSKKRSSAAADRVAKSTDQEKTTAARRFSKSVEANDQAVPQGAPMRRGATHEVVGRDEDGTPVLKRKRFSIS